MIAYVDNDTVVHLTGAATLNVTSGEATPLDAAAIVTFRVQTLDYVDVAWPTGTWPVTMQYVAGSEGHFIGLLSREVVLEPGVLYWFIGTADNGLDQDAAWELPLRAQTRDE